MDLSVMGGSVMWEVGGGALCEVVRLSFTEEP